MSRETKDSNWNIKKDLSGNYCWEAATIAVLMDIRDEIKESNRISSQSMNGIDSIRHFFHALGQERLKLITKEKHRELDLRAKWRRRRIAAAKRVRRK